jgi:hypothetical protein
MSYNGSGTFQINTSGQPVVAGTVISSTAFNALTADLATGLSTAITKDGQTTTTVRIPFAAGINSSLVTDSSSVSTGSIITAGGVGIAKALYVGTNANVAGTLGVTGVATFSAAPIYSSLTASSAVATDASKALVSVTNTGTGNNVLATSPTLVTPVLGAASATSITVAAGAVGTPSITTTGDTNTGIFFPAADTIAFTDGGVESMRIDSSGNVGINTTAMSGKFNITDNTGGAGVATTVTLTNGVDANCYLSLTGSSASDKRVVIGPSTGTAIAFQTNATERMRIDSSGDVSIGATTVSSSARLNVYQADSAQRVVHFENTRNVSGDENLRLVLGSNCNNTSSYPLILTTGGAQKLEMYGNGNIANVNNSYGALSDIKLKENIVDATPKLADLMQVKVRNYNLIGDTTKQIGVVAQELETVFPALVDESPDRDGEGGNLSTVTKSVKYSVFVPMLIKAIQEQQALITALTARITALEAK